MANDNSSESQSSGMTQKFVKGLQGAATLKPISKPSEPVTAPKGGGGGTEKKK